MSYTVLARKYRSQTFDEVVGQEPISQTLKNAIKTSKVAHAYLFAGTRGIGKTTMARILAKSLNCLSSDEPTITPCCKCDSCAAVNAGEDIDVIEIDGATNNGVEQVRQLRENAIYRPARARYKIYIIDEVHMLSVPAFNALLKILEEPPGHVKFIFATTEPNKVIATIQSRCQRFDFNNIAPDAIAGQLKNILKQEKIKFEDDLLLHLAKMANGSMRDALSLLDRLISTGSEVLSTDMLEEFLGSANSEKIYNLVSNISLNEAAGTLEAVDDLISTGLSEVQIADALIECFRDLMVIKSTGVENKILVLTGEQKKRLGELAENFDIAAIVYQITTLEKLLWTLKNSESARALLEAAMLRFALSEHFLNVDALLSQVKGSGGTSLKKKSISRDRSSPTPSSTPLPAEEASQQSCEGEVEQQSDLPLMNLPTKMDSVKEDWPNLLNVIAGKLGNGTAGLLSNALPVRFEGNVLTLRFGASAVVQKKMCEANGRKEQLQSLLGRQWQTDLVLKFEVASEEEQAEYNSNQQKTASQIQNEMINDPTVKTVLHGLGATVTGFEQNKK